MPALTHTDGEYARSYAHGIRVPLACDASRDGRTPTLGQRLWAAEAWSERFRPQDHSPGVSVFAGGDILPVE